MISYSYSQIPKLTELDIEEQILNNNYTFYIQSQNNEKDIAIQGEVMGYKLSSTTGMPYSFEVYLFDKNDRAELLLSRIKRIEF